MMSSILLFYTRHLRAGFLFQDGRMQRNMGEGSVPLLTFQAGLRPLDEEAKDYTVENILRSSDAWLPQ